MRMIWLLYYGFIRMMVSGIWISSFWNKKAKLWIKGRKQWKQHPNLPGDKKAARIWFHVSSLGEFEQAKPVIEEIKKLRPETEIILTFFSPSGYEVRKGYEHARVFYLPSDLPGNAKHWLALVKPDLAVFVKYDTWPGYLNELVKTHIPFILISAHFTPGKWLSSWTVPPTRFLLKKCNMIFLQSEQHIEELKKRGFKKIRAVGDTRVDRVKKLPDEATQNLPDTIKNLAPFDMIAGSTWPEDERLLIPVIEEMKLRVIIAPHDVSPANIKRLTNALPFPHTLYSQIKPTSKPEKVVIVDSIGILSMLYALCPLAYIGGGFGKSIHNILEPMAHGIPVIFGPNFHGFPEAEAMIANGGGISIQNAEEMKSAIHRFRGSGGKEAGQLAGAYIQKNAGATEIVTSYLLESIPFAGKR